MLYQIFETQRSLMEPFADFAQAASKLYGQNNSPMGQNAMTQRVSAGYDLLYRLGKDYEKPQFGIKSVEVEGVEVAIHERIEIDKPFCELRRFKRFTDDAQTLTKLKAQPVVLIVAPLSGHFAARHSQNHAQRPQGLHHRLEKRTLGPIERRWIPPRRLCELRARLRP
jgi:poly(3-hydroxybutyrate) depolymerase